MPGLIQRLLAIDQHEVEFARRGFSCSDPAVRQRLENVGRIFLHGYHAALAVGDQAALAGHCNEIASEHRGFAYEGAAMALALRDGISLRGDSFPRFVAGAGKRHIFMLHVGAGWAYARLPWLRRRMETMIRKLNPVLRWLVIDGYGFHEGYFHGKARLASGDPAPRLSQDARHVFFQGFGRSLWFVHGADARLIASTISSFPPMYRGDAWSGVGLACAYAGGISPDAIASLRLEAGAHAAALAQGAAFAAKARQLAGNPATHTEMACAVFCRMRAEEAAALCDATLTRIDPLRPCPYQHWRELLQQALWSSPTLMRGAYNEPILSPSLVATKPH
jgi:hypothetical protein